MNTLFRLPIWRSVLPIVLFVLSCQKAESQNLVANSSFEDVNTCSELDQPCSPSAWFFLSRKLTTGYFPRYPSATGERHLQLVAASRETPNRQYWETMLLCRLQAGEKYIVSLKIANPANPPTLLNKCPNLRDIGVWFTSKFVFVQGDSLLQPARYLSLTGASVTDLKNGWYEVKKEFVPAVTSPVLIVGNFARSANADIIDQRNWSKPTIDILVDDISVVSVKGVICSGYQRMKDSLYAITARHADMNPEEFPWGVDSMREKKIVKPDTLQVVLPPAPSPKTDTLVLRNIQFDFDHYLMQNPDTLQRYRTLFTRPGIRRILVVGFTDDAGPESYNLDLSKKRAGEIARLLSEKFGVAPELIEADGKGISRVYPTKALNRRVEIYIFH